MISASRNLASPPLSIGQLLGLGSVPKKKSVDGMLHHRRQNSGDGP